MSICCKRDELDVATILQQLLVCSVWRLYAPTINTYVLANYTYNSVWL